MARRIAISSRVARTPFTAPVSADIPYNRYAAPVAGRAAAIRRPPCRASGWLAGEASTPYLDANGRAGRRSAASLPNRLVIGKVGVPMVTAIVLLNIQRDKINDVAEGLAETPGISEVYSISGRYDLVAILRVRSNDEVADVVTKQLLKVESIQHTETLIAFRTYSRHDLEAAFSLGLEG